MRRVVGYSLQYSITPRNDAAALSSWRFRFETPAHPGPDEHVVYTAVVTGVVAGNAPLTYSAMVAYTTSQPWDGPEPPGVRTVSREEAKTMGQDKPFTIDLYRIALLPVTPEWFPRLNEPDHGVLGRAPAKVRQQLEETAETIYRRSPETVQRRGPVWSRRK